MPKIEIEKQRKTNIESFDKNDKIHFIGIGGIGMSGLAGIMSTCGYGKITGSNLGETKVIGKLEDMGIRCYRGHESDYVHDAKLVVFTSAISDSNVEFVYAKKNKIPVVHRSDLLSDFANFYKKSIIVCGSHGKTTTSSYALYIMNSLFKKKVSGCIGSIMNDFGSNFVANSDTEFFVVECDESDGSCIKMKGETAIVTSISDDHLENYDYKVENLQKTFKTFMTDCVKEGGNLIIASDLVDFCKSIKDKLKQRNIKLITVGIDDGDLCATNIRNVKNKVMLDIKFNGKMIWQNMHCPLHGRHNIMNMLCALAGVLCYSKDYDKIKDIAQLFSGADRRFSYLGKVGKAMCFSDYAHHPNEIKCCLRTAREFIQNADMKGRLVAICQPHSYSRWFLLHKQFLEVFDDADELIITDIYSSKSVDDYNINSQMIYDDLCKRYPNKKIKYIPSPLTDVNKYINSIDIDNGVIMYIGAGDIDKYARSLVMEANSLQSICSRFLTKIF